jgi:hypothetical protein
VTNITVKDVIVFRSQESKIVLKPGATQELPPAVYTATTTTISGPRSEVNVEDDHEDLQVEVPSSSNAASLSSACYSHSNNP